MPGILPMKVIKVGTSAQTRIAQACDRCRSKKIRCDGFRPTCTQCSNVGFECKTSDKLSRRAFPRGYTESLEERVRTLEGEIRELKDLLDEKEEKIDMLSKVHAQSPRNGSPRRPSMTARTEDKSPQEIERDDTFKVQQSPFLLDGDATDSYFMGNSSVRTFLDAFKHKLQESGKPCSDFNPDTFTSSASVASPDLSESAQIWKAPPRLVSDQMVNIFFQEWAPLFPILHRPAFLELYDQFVSNPSNLQDRKSLAQLHLVFCIAALSHEARLTTDLESSEKQWVTAIESFRGETSLAHLQCLVLAQLYCLQKGDSQRLLRYKGLAVGLSQRLGLHLSQKRFALGTLTVETRKKVFWSLYTIDCFTAASLGLPKLLKDQDIHCEYPVDYDDEYVTEKGFLPTLPGEYTKLSSALALFRGSRILAQVLAENYPAAATYTLSLRKIASLDEELAGWLNDLPAHLKLEFIQDKPSTHMISSRCPLLSLTYNYIRTLIHRPAVCADLGDRATSSKVALASALKQTVQIVSLLDERNLGFSHCLNKDATLQLCGFGLLYLSLDLDTESRLMKDSQRLLCSVIEKLDRRTAPGSVEFKQLGCSMLSIGRLTTSPSTISSPEIKQSPKSTNSPISPGRERNTIEGSAQPSIERNSRYSSIPSGPQSPNLSKVSRKSQSLALSSVDGNTDRGSIDPPLRTVAPSVAPSQQSSNSSLASKAASERSRLEQDTPAIKSPPSLNGSTPNLDYFSFSGEPSSRPVVPHKPTIPEPDMWDRLLDTLDQTSPSREESVYEWPRMDTLLALSHEDMIATSAGTTSDSTWSPGIWTGSGSDSLSNGPNCPTQSVLSLSDESLEGGADLRKVGGSSATSQHRSSGFPESMIPQLTPEHFTPDSGVVDF